MEREAGLIVGADVFMDKVGLAPLPLPQLSATLDKYLQWVGPLLTEAEYKQTLLLTKKFKTEDGPLLQERLEQLSQEKEGDWLADLWREMYLQSPQPIPVNVNYYMQMDLPKAKTKEQAAFQVAGVMLAFLEQYRRTQKGERLCSQSRRPTEPAFEKKLFGGLRLPLPEGDSMLFSSKEEATVVVMYGGRMYRLPITTIEGAPLEQGQLAGRLLAIWTLSRENALYHPGPLTTADRPSAARLWGELAELPMNRRAMRLLGESLWVLCLEADPFEKADLAFLAGSGRNRYYDKSLQMIVDPRGQVGFNFEHSTVDAGPWLELLARVQSQLPDCSERGKGVPASADSFLLQRLDWQLSRRQMEKLAEMDGVHKKNTASLSVEPWQWKGYGRNKLKALGIGADGLFHCALALAQKKTFERLCSTYEAVSMRHYRQGRTECCRPLTWEMLHWLEVMEDPAANRESRKKALEQALKKHQARLKACQAGRGIERHLFVLEQLALADEQGLNTARAFFEDGAYRQLRKDVLSTSAMGGAFLKSFGFGPVTPEGFGLSYDLREESFFGILSAWKDQALVDPKALMHNLMLAFEALGDLLELY